MSFAAFFYISEAEGRIKLEYGTGWGPRQFCDNIGINSLQEESQNPWPWWRIISHARIVMCSIELILSIIQELKRLVILPGDAVQILRHKTQQC